LRTSMVWLHDRLLTGLKIYDRSSVSLFYLSQNRK